MSQSDREKNLGIVELDREQAPLPVVIFFNGGNCGLELYRWLANILAEKGLIVVIFNWVAENIPGFVGLTPGINLAAWKKDTYGTIPSLSSLPYILKELESLQSTGILADGIDLEKIILGGHSAGGRLALESANPDWFAGISAVFGYGVHSAAGVQHGYEDSGLILSLPAFVPTLIMGGTKDGVIAKSSFRYGLEKWETPATPTIRTFREAISSQRNDSYLVILEGANHFSIADCLDPTISSSLLDFPATYPQEKYRSLIANIISNFINVSVREDKKAAKELDRILDPKDPAIALIERK